MRTRILILLVFYAIAGGSCLVENKQNNSFADNTAQTDVYAAARQSMVEQQIKRRGVKNELVINAMKKVPRHLFVPAKVKDLAYDDNPLSIGLGQTISQPYIVGLMSECLYLKGGEKVLEIGTGSGYQAAILGEIADSVFTIEIVEKLAVQAKEKLKSMGYDNIYTKCGDGYQGWPEYAPFDGIIVTAAPGHIPQPLIDQLKVGGRMIIPVGEWYQELILIRKTSKKKIAKEVVIPVRFVPMTGEAQKKK